MAVYKATNINVGIANTDNFKPFKYKVILLRNTDASVANGILRKKTIDQNVSLNYLSNF